MRYVIRYECRFLQPHYLGPGKADPESTSEEDNVNFYRTRNPETFRRMLEEILDVPEYDLTEENFRKEFSPNPNVPLPEETFGRIFRFYSGRKAIRDAILNDIKAFGESGGRHFYRMYRVPPESVSFSMEPKDEYAPYTESETIDVTLEAEDDA